MAALFGRWLILARRTKRRAERAAAERPATVISTPRQPGDEAASPTSEDAPLQHA
jgi:hypothetical protein